MPCGVWVVTETGFDAGYLEGFEQREDEVNWLVNGWVEQDKPPWLNPGFLEYWQESRSPYQGSFSEIVETDRYENSSECVKDVLDKLSKEAGERRS